MTTASKFREYAKECLQSADEARRSRQLAAKLTNPDDKRAILPMATAWDKAANEREAQLRDGAEPA